MRCALFNLTQGRHSLTESRQICHKIRLLSPFSFRVLSQLAVTCSCASLTRSPQSPNVLRNEASRDLSTHKTRRDNEHQTEIPLMGEIEIPRRSFLVNEQVDVYYIFLLSLSITCNHVYLQTRNSKNITGNSITKHRMSLNCLCKKLLVNNFIKLKFNC